MFGRNPRALINVFLFHFVIITVIILCVVVTKTRSTLINKGVTYSKFARSNLSKLFDRFSINVVERVVGYP